MRHVVLIAGFMLLAAPASAQESRFGVAAGLVIPTSFNVDGTSPPTDPGPIVSFTFDRLVSEHFDLGLFLVGGGFSAGDPEHLVTLFELGGAAHYRLPLGDRLLLRLGVGLGYRRLFADQPAYDKVQGLAANGDLEFSHPLTSRVIGQLRLGVLSQPFGGNDAGDVSWHPVPFIALGAVFEAR